MEQQFEPSNHEGIVKELARGYGISLLGVDPLLLPDGNLSRRAKATLIENPSAIDAVTKYLSIVVRSECKWGGNGTIIMDDTDMRDEPLLALCENQDTSKFNGNKGTIYSNGEQNTENGEVCHWSRPRSRSRLPRGPGSANARNAARRQSRQMGVSISEVL